MDPRHPGALHGKRLRTATFIGACCVPLTCAALVLTGCGDRGDANLTSRASEHTPMLPGAGTGAGERQDTGNAAGSALAQGFGTSGNPAAAPASGALLPPVMHSAD